MMFCRQCGAQIPDGSTFCTACGSPIAQGNEPNQAPSYQQQVAPVQNTQTIDPYSQPQNTTEQPYAQTNEQQNPYGQPQAFNANGQPVPYATQQAVKMPMSPEKKKKLLIFGGIGAGIIVIVIALIVILTSCSKSNSCSAVIDSYLRSAMSGDVDTYISLLPPDIVAYKVKNSYDGDYSEYKDSISNNFSYSSSAIQMNFDMVSEKHCTDKEALLKLNKKYIDRYDAKSSISEVAKCKVKTKVSYGGISSSTDTETVYLLKIDGKWYIDENSMASSISNSKFN